MTIPDLIKNYEALSGVPEGTYAELLAKFEAMQTDHEAMNILREFFEQGEYEIILTGINFPVSLDMRWCLEHRKEESKEFLVAGVGDDPSTAIISSQAHDDDINRVTRPID